MSSALGSSTEASCCVARKILRSPLSASSSARTLDSLPTTNGVIMCGKITMSRMGIMGSLRFSPCKIFSSGFVIVSPLDAPTQCMVAECDKTGGQLAVDCKCVFLRTCEPVLLSPQELCAKGGLVDMAQSAT